MTTQLKPSDYIRQGFTKGALGRDENGECVGFNVKHAVSFCATGAICAAYRRGSSKNIKVSEKLRIFIAQNYPDCNNYLRGVIDHEYISIPTWNNQPERTQEEVIQAFEAIGE